MNNQEYSTIIINAGDEEFELSDIALEKYLRILIGKYQVAEEEEQKIIEKKYDAFNWNTFKSIDKEEFAEIIEEPMFIECIHNYINENRDDEILIQLFEELGNKISDTTRFATYKLKKGTKYYIQKTNYGERIIKMDNINWKTA
jgi:hypothetical protein